jgi:hypothetical protein
VQAKNLNQLTADFAGDPEWTSNDVTFLMTVDTALGGDFQLANGWGSAAAPAIYKVNFQSIISILKYWNLLKLDVICPPDLRACVDI